MNRTVLALVLSLATTQAEAISRYTSTSMSCARVQDIIQNEGAAIMRNQGRSGLTLYDRYVIGPQFCEGNEVVELAYIPTTDTKSCPVYHCVKFEFFLDY
jgi:hypothetical protein